MCAGDGVEDVMIHATHPGVSAHAQPVLLLRHELASRGHLLHICGHCRQTISRNSPESEGGGLPAQRSCPVLALMRSASRRWSIERIGAEE